MIAAIWMASVFAAGTVGFFIGAMMRSERMARAREVNEKLARALREAGTSLRMAGLNSGADMALKTIENLKEEFPC